MADVATMAINASLRLPRNDIVDNVKRILIVVIVASFAALLGLLFLTNPLQSGPIGILAIFVSLYVLVMGCIALVIYFISRVVSQRRSTSFLLRRPLEKISLLHSYYYASVLALAPVMLMGMGSVGKTGVGELVLVTLFVVAACIYVRKMTIRS